MAHLRLLSASSQHNRDQEIRSYPASQIAAHNQQENSKSTHHQVATSRRKANNVSRLCQRAQLPPHDKPSSKNHGRRSWRQLDGMWADQLLSCAPLFELGRQVAQAGENGLRLRPGDRPAASRSRARDRIAALRLRLRKKAAVGPFPVSTTAFLYLKTLVDCDEWSRCETDEDLACYCTSRLVTLANAN